jgi:dimethyladenosine transferase 1, mitochondrial
MIPESEIREWDSPIIPDIRLVGNLPFNVATPFLIRLLNSMHNKNNLFSFGRVPAVLTFQHEVAHRMTAEPMDPERCRLSVICQNYARVEHLFTLPGYSRFSGSDHLHT